MSTSNRADNYHHGDLRSALLDAAYDALSTQNADTLSLRQIARAVGVSAMAPYRHFPDKDALLDALVLRGFDALFDDLSRAESGLDGLAALQAQACAYLRFATAKPALFRLMFSGRAHGKEQPRGNVGPQGRGFDVLRHRLMPLVAEDRVEILAVGLWSMVHGMATLTLDGALVEPDVAQVVAALLQPLSLSE